VVAFLATLKPDVRYNVKNAIIKINFIPKVLEKRKSNKTLLKKQQIKHKKQYLKSRLPTLLSIARKKSLISENCLFVMKFINFSSIP